MNEDRPLVDEVEGDPGLPVMEPVARRRILDRLEVEQRLQRLERRLLIIERGLQAQGYATLVWRVAVFAVLAWLVLR